MNLKTFLPIILGIFFLTLISASPLQEFLSEDVTGMNITITQSTSEVQFYLNTSGTSFDLQDFEYEDLLIKDIPLSTILNEIDFSAEYNEGEIYPELTYFHIKEASMTNFLINNILTYLEENYDVDDLNSNLTLAQKVFEDFMGDNNYEMYGNMEIEKRGINYKVNFDKGYGDVPSKYDEEIAEIIETAIYSMNLKFIGDYIPFNEYFSFNWDFDASADLTDLKYENGNYEILLSADGYEKIIYLTLDGIDFRTGEFIPEDTEILSKIGGLVPGTVISFEILNQTPKKLPSVVRNHGVLNITTSQETEGDIYFKVLKSEVENKDYVKLYVWENSSFGMSWDKLPTNLISEDNDYFYYKAHTFHFSIFLIGEIIVSNPPPSGGGGGNYNTHEKKEDKKIPEINFCTTGEKMCSGNSVYLCAGDRWKVVENCDYGCSNGECKKEPIEINPSTPKGMGITGAFIGFVQTYSIPILITILIFLVTVFIIIILKNKK